MLEVIGNKTKLQFVQQQFTKIVEDIPHMILPTAIKFRGGPYHSTVWWIPTLMIWAHFGFPPSQKRNRNRYWNVFGINKPGKSVRIVCEINSPFEGIDRRIGGVIAEDSDGEYSILHRGNFRGGGLTQSKFMQRYKGSIVEVIDGHTRTDMAHILKQGSSSAALDLRDFILEVGRLKGLY